MIHRKTAREICLAWINTMTNQNAFTLSSLPYVTNIKHITRNVVENISCSVGIVGYMFGVNSY